jgi:hypothetical protein
LQVDNKFDYSTLAIVREHAKLSTECSVSLGSERYANLDSSEGYFGTSSLTMTLAAALSVWRTERMLDHEARSG